MTDLRTAVQLAVTMLKTGMPEYDARDVLEVLEAALEQPEQEPVDTEAALRLALDQRDWAFKQLQAQHPRREWRGLTEEEMEDVWMRAPQSPSMRECLQKFARAIEAALKERNA